MRYILDTNVMLLLVVGATNINWLEQHKNIRSRAFNVEHYRKMIGVIGHPNQIVTTSNILTEVSNLLAQTDSRKVLVLRETFANLISAISEIHLPSKLAIRDEIFLRFGLTDALLLKLEKQDFHILSVDARLCYACSQIGLPHTNLTPLFFE